MADKQTLNGQAPEEVRKRRHLKAKNYRELYLLPRFVVDENNQKRKLEVKDRTTYLVRFSDIVFSGHSPQLQQK